MKHRFISCRRKRGGVFYIEGTETEKQESLGTQDRAEATSQLQLNLQIAKAYLAGTDPGVSARTWQDALSAIIEVLHVVFPAVDFSGHVSSACLLVWHKRTECELESELCLSAALHRTGIKP